MSEELWMLSATQIAQGVRAGAFTASEVAACAIERVARMDSHIHAFCHRADALALAMAQAVDDRIARGEDPGPLAGVPIGIKDLIVTRDMKTRFGSRLYQDFQADEDDVVVERLRDAGAVFLGKTNVSELGYGGCGHNPLSETTRNPWNLSLTSGGSSAGSGAAVAAGLCPIAVGSDGGGSIRIPAAHCGLFGFKPSMGRVPLYPGCRDARYPGVSSWESLEHLGPLSRTVQDSALMMSVMAGPDPRDRHSIPCTDVDWLDLSARGLAGRKIGFSEDFGYLAVEPEVRAIFRQALTVFERELGCELVEVRPDWPDPVTAFRTIVAMETDLDGMRALLRDRSADVSPHLVDMVMRDWTAADFNAALMARKRFFNDIWKLMRDIDFLLTPTLTVPPFRIDIQGPEKVDGQMVRPTQWSSFLSPFNLTGQPAASLPAGWTRDQLPVGLQIVGRHLADSDVLRLSAAYQEAAPWMHRWPAIAES
ncbi:MAG: amidase [Castellaniella sp.]